MKLRSKILVYTLPLILSPLVLLAFANYYFVTRANRIQAQEEKVRRVNEALSEIRREAELARKDSRLLASLPAVSNYLSSFDRTNQEKPGERKHAAEALKIFFDQNPFYLELTLVDANGIERIKFSRLNQNSERKNVGDQEFYKRGLVSLSIDYLQTPVERVSVNKYITGFLANVSSEKFLGMILLKLDVGVFKRSLRPLVDRKLSAVMFDDRGIIFANLSESGVNVPKIEENQLAKIAEQILMEETIGLDERFQPLDDISGSFFVRPAYFYPKDTMLTAPKGGKWFLGIIEPNKASGVSDTFSILFFSVLALAITALFFVTRRMAERVTIPLEKVNDATALVGRGNFDLELDVETGDEIEDLAGAIKDLNADLIEYQSQLVQSAKLATIGEMASEISHEIQNRISGLSLWLQCLDTDAVTDSQRRQYVDEMKQGLEGFMIMLATLKQYYKTPVLMLASVNLNDLVSDSLLFVDEELVAKGLSLEKALDSDVPSFIGDDEKLKSVIINLVLNAIDAVEEGGTIRIKTERYDSERIGLSVVDDGCGIADEDLSRVFYPFYSTKDGGSGLGLAVCSNIISAHGGEIKVKSELGKGTEFRVLLDVTKK